MVQTLEDDVQLCVDGIRKLRDAILEQQAQGQINPDMIQELKELI